MTANLSRFLNFRPPGPVAAAFLKDRANRVRGLLGPVGAGKTVTAIVDHFNDASHMPRCIDGIVRFKVAVIGATYGQLERNLYPTWKSWIPEDGAGWTEAEWEGGGGRFATHRIGFEVKRQGSPLKVEFESVFAAIGEHSVDAFMRGFEPTKFHFYEMDLLPEAVLTNAMLRLGRYPRQDMLPKGTEFRSNIVGDYNAPDIDSWPYRLFEEDQLPGYKLYKQPSGRSPQAENKHNLPKDYYENQVTALAKNPHLLRRMVDAEYGPLQDGTPVFPEYSDQVHLARDVLVPRKGVPLRLGFDAGLRGPACAIGQWLPNGQWLILGEVVTSRMGPKTFAGHVKAWLARNAPHHDIEGAWGDPWGFTGSDKNEDLLAWMETVMGELGITILPAPSNNIDLRLQAVREEMLTLIDGGTASLLISPACKVLRKGMASHYRYTKQRQATIETTSVKPLKDEHADIQDALQYLMLGSKGRYGVISGEGRRRRARGGDDDGKTVVLQNTWNPWG